MQLRASAAEDNPAGEEQEEVGEGAALMSEALDILAQATEMLAEAEAKVGARPLLFPQGSVADDAVCVLRCSGRQARMVGIQCIARVREHVLLHCRSCLAPSACSRCVSCFG